MWNRLTCFLDHPILELTTNAAETPFGRQH
jgi:hypothetical protein